jgi:hypothetical protein
MAAKISIRGLLSAIVVLVGIMGASNAPNGSNSFSENLQVAAECDTNIYPDTEIPDPVYVYRILPDSIKCESSPIFIDAYNERSCSVIILDVPVSGYYNFRVEAGYSDSSDKHQDQEDYILEINSAQRDTIDDLHEANNSFDCKHKYKWVEHGIQYLNAGSDTVTFLKGNQEPVSTNSVHFKTIEITRLPTMLPEPTFTQGSSNVVSWVGIPNAADHKVVCFDSNTGEIYDPPYNLMKTQDTDTTHTHYEGLKDGCTYCYYVDAFFDGEKFERSNIVCSTQDASPPEQVEINSLEAFNNETVSIRWRGVCDSTSGVTKYIILRKADDSIETEIKTIASIPSKIKTSCNEESMGDSNSDYEYIDSDSLVPNMFYRYRVDAVDSVNNSRAGEWSSTVVNLCPPVVKICSDTYQDEEGNKYVKGNEIILCAEIPDTCSGIQMPDGVKFQAVRDSMSFFEAGWKPEGKFFDSGWKKIESATDHTFSDFGDCACVNGVKYYYRVQFKDDQGNHSQWSDTLSAIQDCYPPSDISNLSVIPKYNADKTDGWMELKWNSAVDYGSGVKIYKIYRQIAGGETTIFDTTDTTYNDHFRDIKENKTVCYRIGSVDNVGNGRGKSDTNYEVCEWCAVGPQLYWKPNDSTSDSVAFVAIDLEYDFENVLNFIYEIAKSGKIDTIEKDLNDEVLKSLRYIKVDLPEAGTYQCCAQTIFKDKSKSTWSDTIKLEKASNFSNKDISVKTCALHPNYPNPFNAQTRISYQLPEEGWVSIDIYNIQGQRIASVVDGQKQAGIHTITWNGTDKNGFEVASGLYFCKIHIKLNNNNNFHSIRRMMLLR